MTSVEVNGIGSAENVDPGEPWPGEPSKGPFDDFAAEEELKERRAGARDDKAKSGPPTLAEWQDFFARILIKGLTERYIALAFRDIDEDWLTDRELDRISLSEVERDRIARPFAELANKLKVTRKHGRVIIGLSDSIDSVLVLGMWFGRVNRIAAKYKGKTVQGKVVDSERTGQDEGTPAANGHVYGPGSLGAYFPESPGTG